MLNIPKTTYDDYSIKAFVSINNVASAKGIAANVGQTAFASFDLNRTGHFISGRFNKVHREIEANDDPGQDNYASYPEIEMLPGDTFALVYYNGSDTFLLNGASRFLKASNYYFDASKKTITNKYKGSYTISLDTSDMIKTSGSNVVRPVYVGENSNWTANYSWTALYLYNSTNDDTEWLDYKSATNYLIDPTEYDRIIAVRMNKDATINDKWGGKFYNETASIEYPSAPEWDDSTSKMKDCLYIYDNCSDRGWGSR